MKKFYFLLLGFFLFSGVNAQIINFPDANFKAKLLYANSSNTVAKDLAGNYFKIDANSDGEIEVNEALQVSCLDVNCISCTQSSQYLINLSGLESFNNLQYFNCTFNNISGYNFSSLINLKELKCTYNQFSDLQISGLINLQKIDFQANNLTVMDLRELINLQEMNCGFNNQLNLILLKNGSLENYLYFDGNPNLQFICVDDNQLTSVQQQVNQLGYSNCVVNSYCSFTPGGRFYTIQGETKFDSNNNGCDASDIIFPNLKFSITDGTLSGSTVSNETGVYSIPVQAGTHTITPVLENPNYFSISPSNITVVFPTQTSPFIQDFCITANGVHPDVEVTLLPTVPARPGFDAKYSIIYKNKGNTTQSGSVNLTFNDAVLDLVSSNPATTNQTVDNLLWDYSNLLPFETREITLTLNVNSPTETPAVNIGDQLNFRAVINPITGDETPENNIKGVKQIVVGSYDPNDKTCLEGTTIEPSMIGEYVHYLIRFENTGTYPAQNIVVKDIIDTAKFDINSLIPIKGSHEFVTKISDTNKVEFIFENINLPFDNATNDGFVAFKIKTLPTLVVGDTFTNSANIYFDYNFPIVTNPASTTVQALGTSDFEFAKYFSLYPNPASSILNLSVKKGIEVSSINIYNTLGQLVIAIPNAQSVSNIDVSSLRTGNYFIKMTTDKGTSNTKFIKN